MTKKTWITAKTQAPREGPSKNWLVAEADDEERKRAEEGERRSGGRPGQATVHLTPVKKGASLVANCPDTSLNVTHAESPWRDEEMR